MDAEVINNIEKQSEQNDSLREEIILLKKKQKNENKYHDDRYKKIQNENVKLVKQLETLKQKPLVIPVDIKLPIVQLTNEGCNECFDKDVEIEALHTELERQKRPQWDKLLEDFELSSELTKDEKLWIMNTLPTEENRVFIVKHILMRKYGNTDLIEDVSSVKKKYNEILCEKDSYIELLQQEKCQICSQWEFDYYNLLEDCNQWNIDYDNLYQDYSYDLDCFGRKQTKLERENLDLKKQLNLERVISQNAVKNYGINTNNVKVQLRKVADQLKYTQDKIGKLEVEKKQLLSQVQLHESKIKSKIIQDVPELPNEKLSRKYIRIEEENKENKNEIQKIKNSLKGKEKITKDLKNQLQNLEAINEMYVENINNLNLELCQLKKEKRQKSHLGQQLSKDPGKEYKKDDRTYSDFPEFIDNLNECFPQVQLTKM